MAKICIYLLVTYSIILSLALSWGAYKGYTFYSDFIAQVTRLEKGPVKTSSYIKNFELPKEVYGDSTVCKEVHQDWIDFDSIADPLKHTVLAVEDASFYIHPGIDIESIINALETNKKRGKKSFGASTISQQIAKNLFLSNEKSYVRKAKELGYTLLLERELSKDRIFELYLNLAQMGPCHFGCEAASQFFYKKSCSKLNLDQAIGLASILANPNRYNPNSTKSKLIGARRQLIFSNLYGTGYLHRDTTEVDSTAIDEESDNEENPGAFEKKILD